MLNLNQKYLSPGFSPFESSDYNNPASQPPLDLLPPDLRGGVSSVSSRRPSYAAEFSTRSRSLLEGSPTFNGAGGNNQLGEPSHEQLSAISATLSNPNQSSVDAEKWMSVPNWSLWNNLDSSAAAAATSIPGGIDSSPKSKSLFMSLSPSSRGRASFGGYDEAITTNLSPRNSTGSLNSNSSNNCPSPGLAAAMLHQQRSFRSLSFSSPDSSFPRARSPLGSSILSSFNEEPETLEYKSTPPKFVNSKLVSSVSSLLAPIGYQQQQQGNLWFHSNEPIPEGSRRHSYAAGDLLKDEPVTGNGKATSNTSDLKTKLSTVSNSNELQIPTSKQTIKPTLSNHGVGSKHNSVEGYFSNDETNRNYHSSISVNISPTAAASLISVPSKKLYLVQFKANRVDVFYIPDTSSLSVKINDLVIVDADRGRDLGKVIKDHVTAEEAGLLKLHQQQEQQAILQPNSGQSSSSPPSAPAIMMPKQILRFAQPNEVQQILGKKQDEERAVKTCLAKVQEKGLAMQVIDAEYQWDRRKLTFFYSASVRIDFRDLVRELFRIYKTRIWMCAVANVRSKPIAPSELSPVSSTESNVTAGSMTSTTGSATTVSSNGAPSSYTGGPSVGGLAMPMSGVNPLHQMNPEIMQVAQFEGSSGPMQYTPVFRPFNEFMYPDYSEQWRNQNANWYYMNNRFVNY